MSKAANGSRAEEPLRRVVRVRHASTQFAEQARG